MHYPVPFFVITYYDGNWREAIYDVCIHGLSDYIINLKGFPSYIENLIHASFYIQKENNNNCLSCLCMVNYHREENSIYRYHLNFLCHLYILYNYFYVLYCMLAFERECCAWSQFEWLIIMSKSYLGQVFEM